MPSVIPVYVGFSVLSVVLGVVSLVFRHTLVEWNRSVWGTKLTQRQRRRREIVQAAVGVYLVLFGIAVLVFRLE
jgi:hypothetical protein